MRTRLPIVLLALAAAFYVAAGANHFLKPVFYLKMMPPYVPWHAAMVYISGIAEVLGGVGLLIPSVRRAAAWGLVALLVAVFPANIYMATNPVEAGAGSIPAAALYGRLLLQPIFIWWLLWCSKPRR
ncbi:MAG TPA: DoxX family protein [Bryobacteraceae bacterium]|nr:DoxX family protein [Bryobacteraceae bacterium]